MNPCELYTYSQIEYILSIFNIFNMFNNAHDIIHNLPFLGRL